MSPELSAFQIVAIEDKNIDFLTCHSVLDTE